MRENLYHGKRLDNGEWIEGSLISFGDGGKAILPSKSDVFHSHRKGFVCCEDCYEVDPATVGQYVGRTDKDGTKIFEGSVLRSAWGTVVVIYYDGDYLQFRAREISPHMRENAEVKDMIAYLCETSSHTRENSLDYYDNGKMEVIGHVSDSQWSANAAMAERKG